MFLNFFTLIFSTWFLALSASAYLTQYRDSQYYSDSQHSQCSESTEIDDSWRYDDCAELMSSGPITADSAAIVIRRALQFLSPANNERDPRSMSYDANATRLVRLLTGIPDVNLSTIEFVRPQSDNDEAYVELTLPNEKRNISTSTMHIIDRMRRLKKSGKTIRAKYNWYQPYWGYRISEYLRNNGTRRTRMEQINDHALAMFRKYRAQGRAIRGYMIRAWATQKARDLDSDFFRASTTWLQNFKKRNNISGRAVFDRVGQTRLNQRDRIESDIAHFREQFPSVRRSYADAAIWNFDHSSFNYEFTAERTLSWRGERDTLVVVNRPDAATHSYTIIPLISRDGRIVGPLLICLQERSGLGRFLRPRVENLERQYRNILTFCSTSGKMTTNLTVDYVRNVLIPTHVADRTSAARLRSSPRDPGSPRNPGLDSQGNLHFR